MRILIGYDGTNGADAALEDLARAGLPPDAEAMVLTVADASMAVASRAFAMTATGTTVPPFDHRQNEAASAVERAREVAADAAERLRTRFPGWHVSPDVWGGSPASSIALKADAWRPDLVVVGWRGQTKPVRLLLGSVARKVLSESRCSVRISRAQAGVPGQPMRILVGHDGGGSGQAALLAAAARSWPAGSKIRAVAVHDADVSADLGPEFSPDTWPMPDIPHDGNILREVLDDDVASVQRPGLDVYAELASGVPTSVLLRTARRWSADCIFVGTTSRSRASRFLLGSVSSAVAERALCSVEVVRTRAP
jgi:nucleotide-binding universal stress UspA family protein